MTFLRMLLKAVHIVLFLWGFLSIMVLGRVIGTVQPEEGRALQILALTLGGVLMLGFLFVDRRFGPGVTRGSKGLPPTWSAQESRTFMHAPEDVWAVIRPAEASCLLDDVDRAFTIPGTGGGVGEQQCFILSDGSVSITEVVSEEAGRSAATKAIAPPGLDESQTYRLEPTAGGCSLTMGVTLEVPATATAEWLSDYQDTWRAQTRQFLKALERVLSDH